MTAWEESAGGGSGATYTYPETGGVDDDDYLQIDSSGLLPVSVVSTDKNVGTAKWQAIADYGLNPGDLATFEMYMKKFDSGTGTETAGIKLEWGNEPLGAGTGVAMLGANGSTGDMKKSFTSEWAAYRWPVSVPSNATHVVFVPVQHDDVTTGYDDLGFVPNPTVDGAVATVSKLIFGGDEGVVFKNLSLTVAGGQVSVDPFSISSISSITGGSVITWTAQSGVTYDVEYKTSLVGGSWSTTVTGVTGDGSVSATSDVDAASAFFRVIGQ